MYDRFSKVGGAALLVGSVVAIVDQILLQLGNGERDFTNPVNIAAQWASLPITLLIVFGLPALVTRLAGRAPVLALLGSAGVALGFLVYGFAIALIDAAVLPYLAAHHFPVSQPPPAMFIALIGGGIGEIAGAILLGVAAFRSGAVPRVAAGLLVGSGVVYAIGLALPGWVGTIGVVALAAGLAICGFWLVRSGTAGTAAVTPAPAEA
jgi:hypothetical protein